MSRTCEVGFTGLFAAKIAEREASDVLEGKLPDGTEIPVFSFDEIKRGVANLPRRYAVVMDFETAKKSKSGNETFDDLKDDPLMMVRAGGLEAAQAYLDKARDRHKTAVMGNWHSFNDIDPDQPQTRVLFLAGNEGGVSTEIHRDSASRQQGYVGIWGTHYRIPIDAEFGLRGDLIHFPVQCAHPDWAGAFDTDPAQACITRQSFLHDNCESGRLVLTAHFPATSMGYVERAGDAFRFRFRTE